MWTILILVLYIVIAISIVISILLHGAKPSKSLSWLLAIFTIPVGGIILYLLLGRNRRKNKLLKLKRKAFLDLPAPTTEHTAAMSGKYKKLMKLVYSNSHFSPTNDNQIKLLKDGKTTFESIFEALENANIRIHLQYYIFEEGELANKLIELFERKIAEGVQIRMIYDVIGSLSLSKKYLKKLTSMGVEVYPFLPFKFGRFLSSLNYRNHRKIIAVDGKVAFTGGINISDKYLKGDPALGNWHDMHMRIEGSAAMHLDYIFAMDWYLVSQKYINSITVMTDGDSNAGKLVQIVSGGPDDDFPSLEQAYLNMMYSAKHYLYITNPYVIPGQAIIQALQSASLSGVDVRLLISANADNKIVNWSVRSYFETLLKAGVKIYLFPDGFLHSKIIVCDDAVSSIGTANLDDRSFEQNYEVNAIVYDEEFANLLKADFLADANVSSILSYHEYIKRPWTDKLKEGFGKVFSPLL
ncbi:cardiolipin synthase [Maribacter sp. CXY002]|uniref:cardiolipin synthase n=1 Tax=Maribacter luteocoastalis TaxID=3407671 RepID=UPI003B672A4F